MNPIRPIKGKYYFDPYILNFVVFLCNSRDTVFPLTFMQIVLLCEKVLISEEAYPKAIPWFPKQNIFPLYFFATWGLILPRGCNGNFKSSSLAVYFSMTPKYKNDYFLIDAILIFISMLLVSKNFRTSRGKTVIYWAFEKYTFCLRSLSEIFMFSVFINELKNSFSDFIFEMEGHLIGYLISCFGKIYLDLRSVMSFCATDEKLF